MEHCGFSCSFPVNPFNKKSTELPQKNAFNVYNDFTAQNYWANIYSNNFGFKPGFRTLTWSVGELLLFWPPDGVLFAGQQNSPDPRDRCNDRADPEDMYWGLVVYKSLIYMVGLQPDSLFV